VQQYHGRNVAGAPREAMAGCRKSTRMWETDTRALGPAKFNGTEHHNTLYCAGAGQQLQEHPSNRAVENPFWECDWLAWVAHKWMKEKDFCDRAVRPAAVVARY